MTDEEFASLPPAVLKPETDTPASAVPVVRAPVFTPPPRPINNHSAFGTGRTLPHSLEAEEYLLSCCLLDGADALVLTAAKEAGIRPDSFYDPKHGIVFQCLLDLHARNQPVELYVVAEELKAAGKLDLVGGYAFLIQISSRVPTTAQAGYFIEKVLEQSILRNLIRSATGVVENCYNFSGDITAFLADQSARVSQSANGYVAPASKQPPRGIGSFMVPKDSDETVLLGNRYLCRGDGMVVVSSSGMGKSSLCIQAAVTWALGLPFMGIKPNGPLRSLIIQSEDSDGDIGEVWASICHKMRLSDEQRKTASEMVVIITDRINRGPQFLNALQRHVTAAKYDLVWINPLAAFITGDASTQENAADFLRAGLNGLNTPARFGYIIIQHTTKPATGKDRSERRWHEVMYDMAGSYDIIGWARTIISLRPTETFGEFNLVLAKRGRRAGVTKKVPQGAGYRLESAISIPLRHCDEKMIVSGIDREVPVIFWELRDEIPQESSEALKPNGRPRTNSASDFMGIFPVDPRNAVGINDLLRSALTIRHISKSTLYSVIDEALEKGLVTCITTDPKRPLYHAKKIDTNYERDLDFDAGR